MSVIHHPLLGRLPRGIVIGLTCVALVVVADTDHHWLPRVHWITTIAVVVQSIIDYWGLFIPLPLLLLNVHEEAIVAIIQASSKMTMAHVH